LGPVSGMESISISNTAARFVDQQGGVKSARTPTSLGTLRKARSQIELGIWRGNGGHGRAGQAFELLSPAWWTGPPPIPRCGPPQPTSWMTRSSRRSPSRGAACGFWIGAWGQRGPALQGTDRLSSPARCGLAAQWWIGRPVNSSSIELMLHRTPGPDVEALCLVTHWASRNAAFGPIRPPHRKGAARGSSTHRTKSWPRCRSLQG
jgi:hypothetical protein